MRARKFQVALTGLEVFNTIFAAARPVLRAVVVVIATVGGRTKLKVVNACPVRAAYQLVMAKAVVLAPDTTKLVIDGARSVGAAHRVSRALEVSLATCAEAVFAPPSVAVAPILRAARRSGIQSIFRDTDGRVVRGPATVC